MNEGGPEPQQDANVSKEGKEEEQQQQQTSW